MKKINRTYLFVSLLVVVGFFSYFGSSIMMDGGVNRMMNHNGWMIGRDLGWLPIIFTLCLMGIIGWLLFKKKA